ncbi:plasmid segregation protein ParM [Escherichia coli]|uniref:plasmid segregation protein ParM n=1 Tax=Escherichia coli TaxID=562 RepID=UPI002AACFE9F|nr:plasmid segregation protein ParM [Escherichia coli]MDY7503350.1 plasmid segregation protein ParM [Escherichia coli]
MESNIKGLVAAGHEMASELKAECGAVDMRSVAKLISDLATQLEVQLVRANALAGFSGYGRVMVVGGGAEIVAPAIREACGVNATFIADGVPQFALVNGLYAMDKE